MSEETRAAAGSGMVSAVGAVNCLMGALATTYAAYVAIFLAPLVGRAAPLTALAVFGLFFSSSVGVLRRRFWGPAILLVLTGVAGAWVLGTLLGEARTYELVLAGVLCGYCLLCSCILLSNRAEFN
jgi:hypothetical protein